MSVMACTRTPTSFAGQLLAHQGEALDFLQQNPRALCALATGLGKTATAAAMAAWLLDTDQLSAEADRPSVVYLTDAPLLEQTAAEVRRFCPSLAVVTTKESRYSQVRPGPRVREKAVQNQGHRSLVVVGTYQWLRARIETIASDWSPRLLVLDECTAISGGGSEQLATLQLSRRAERVVGLSATPWQSNPLQAFTVLETIQTSGLWPRGHFEREYVQWSQAYEIAPGRWVQPKPEGFRTPGHHDDFATYLHSVMHRVTIEQTGQRLPTLTRSVSWVPLLPQQAVAYRKAQRLGGAAGTTAMQVAGRHAGEISCLVQELVTQLRGPWRGRQAVVYCETLAVLPLAAAALQAAGITSVVIEGKVPQNERDQAVQAFRDGSVQVLLGSSVLERGLNLQMANLLISLDSSWTDERETQREGRICRLGSEHEQAHHLTLLPDTTLSRKKLERVTQRGWVAQNILSDRW